MKTEASTFETDAEFVLRRLRNAFAGVIEALPALVKRPHDLGRVLDIDKQLSWRIFKVARESDPFTAARHLPGQAGVRIFLEAAARNGVSSELTGTVAKALEEFDKLIGLHAGDRTSLEMMVNAKARSGREDADSVYRKAAFRGNSYIWGVQAKAQLKTDILLPAPEKGVLDICSLRGFIGLRRLRANVSWVVARGRCVDNDGESRRGFVREPLDSVGDPEGTMDVPLLRGFCSTPLPQFRRVAGQHGFVEDELVEGPVGDTAALTCITAEVCRGVASYYRDEHNRFGEVISRVRTPCEVLIFDQLVHEDIFGRLHPELAVYGELADSGPFPVGGRHRNLLEVSEKVEYLGKGTSGLHTPHVPRYAEMARYVFDRLRCDADRFDVYRVRMRYPMIPASVVMRCELPERPA